MQGLIPIWLAVTRFEALKPIQSGSCLMQVQRKMVCGIRVFLNVNRRQFRCQSCGKVFSEELDLVRKRRTYTVRLAEKVIKEVLETNVTSAAARNRMTGAEIETLLKEQEADG